MPALPQFPLGTVLFPSMVLPLHIFEERYRTLMHDVIFGDGPDEPTKEFGVPLIERGFEVGGDDVRSSVGTVARIVEHELLDDGRWVIATVGTRRYRVLEWLDDRPYPRAEVEDWPDIESSRDLSEDLANAVQAFKRCLATAAEAGYDVGPIPDIDAEPEVGIAQLAALAPVSQLDRHQFLCAEGPEQRLPLIADALAGAQEIFEFELFQNSDPES
jgi:Lon protease-like protein